MMTASTAGDEFDDEVRSISRFHTSDTKNDF